MKKRKVDHGKEKTRDEIPSASVLLDLAKIEYACEDERTKNIDNRVGILISAIVLLMTFYLPTVKIGPILEKNIASFWQGFPYYVLLSFHALTLIFAFVCLICFARAISVREYSRIPNNEITSLKMGQDRNDLVSYIFAKRIVTLIESNEDSNNAKIEQYTRGLCFLIITIFFMAISNIMASIILK